MDWMTKLRQTLSSQGSEHVYNPATGRITLVSEAGLALPHPLELMLDADGLASYLERVDSPELPDVIGDSAEAPAAWRIFLVHLDEALATAGPEGRRIEVIPSGLAAVPAHDEWLDLPTGGYVWRADPPTPG